MTLAKTLKKLCSNHMVIFTVLAAFVLVYFVNSYSAGKGLVKSGMQSNGVQQGPPLIAQGATSADILAARNAANVPQIQTGLSEMPHLVAHQVLPLSPLIL